MIIYKATNLFNNKSYIGQTVGQLARRKSVHKYQINKGSKNYFIKALRKYGIDNFRWEVVDIVSTIEELNEREIYWILFLNSNNPSKGYNISAGGKNGKLNEIGIERIRKIRKGKKVSKIARERMSESATKRGNHITPEGREKISIANKKNKNSAFLKKKDIYIIYKLWNTGLTQQAIANKFGVTQANINIVLKGDTWKEMYNKYCSIFKRKTRLTKDNIKEIKKLKGVKNNKELSKLFKVSKATISNVMNSASLFYRA